jgi:hypothetical protein
MKNLKESSPLEISARYYKTADAIYFSAKNNFNFEAHTYFLSRNLIEEFNGIFKSGIFIDLNENLNLKHFKIEIFE